MINYDSNEIENMKKGKIDEIDEVHEMLCKWDAISAMQMVTNLELID